MDDIHLQKSIQDLTLGFFKKINANISQKEKIFTVLVSDNYNHLFGKFPFSITFDSKTALESTSELIAPGSKLLRQITNLCKMKGPITTGITENLDISTNTSNLKYGIRFYFHITYNSIKHFSDVSYVDLDINSSEIINISQNLHHYSTIEIDHLNFENMSSLFLKSTKIIRKKFEIHEKKYVESIFVKKKSEIKNIQEEYNRIILEVESQIKENDKKILDESERYKLYDESLEKISTLRNEQNRMLFLTSKKFNVILSYDLISVMIFLYYENNQ